MNHIIKRIAILSGVFAAALGVFFFANNRWNSGQDQAVYMDTGYDQTAEFRSFDYKELD